MNLKSQLRILKLKFWTPETQSKIAFRGVTILLMVIVATIIAGIVDFYLSAPDKAILTAVGGTRLHISLLAVIGISLCFVLVSVSVRFITKETLVVLLFTRARGTTSLKFIVRLLSALPTLLLGNAVLILADVLQLRPSGPVSTFFFVALTIIAVALPTALNIGQEVLKEYDKRLTQQAGALGLSGIVTGRCIVMPSIRRSFNVAIIIAIGRTIIEAYLVLGNVLRSAQSEALIFNGSEDILAVFYQLYSSMTIQSNVGLILLLFVAATIANIWFVSMSAFNRS